MRIVDELKSGLGQLQAIMTWLLISLILEAYNKGLQKWAQITEANYVLTVTHLWTRT